MPLLNRFQIVTVFPDATAPTTKGLSAGTTAVNSSAIDLLADIACNVIVDMGAITATGTGTLQLQRSADGTTWTNITGAVYNYTDADANKTVPFCVSQLNHRYVRVAITRATANSAITGIKAYNVPRNQVPTQVTTANQCATQPVVVAGTWS